jgi:hypothetical protein
MALSRSGMLLLLYCIPRLDPIAKDDVPPEHSQPFLLFFPEARLVQALEGDSGPEISKSKLWYQQQEDFHRRQTKMTTPWNLMGKSLETQQLNLGQT